MSNQLKQQTFSRAIVYGTISYSLGANKKQTDKNTHRWCVYVRGPNNEDLSTFIDKVVFVLHETFPDHQRAISKPPFEVTEKGWGEFDILIQIHFKTHYPQLELVHKLKFYGAKSGGTSQSTKKPVISEFYDEIVFVNPSIEFYDLLTIEKYLQNDERLVQKESKVEGEQNQIDEEIPATEKEEEEHYDWKQHYLKFDASEHKQKLEDALAVIKVENDKIKSDSDKFDKDIENLNQEIEQLQKEYDLKQKKCLEEQNQVYLSTSQEGNNQYPNLPPNFQIQQNLGQPIEYQPNESVRNVSLPVVQNIPLGIPNSYPNQGQYPIGQSSAGPVLQQVPPPHMMQNMYSPQNPNMKMNNQLYQPPHMPM